MSPRIGNHRINCDGYGGAPPMVVRIQSEPWPVVCLSFTLAFTLPPKRIRRKVPTSSAVNSLTGTVYASGL